MGSHGKTRKKEVAAPHQDPTTRVMDGIRRLVHVLRVGALAAETESGISGAQMFVLQLLAQAPAASMQELAEKTRTHQSSVSVVVSRLVERGLVRRVASRKDARRRELQLTPKGKALVGRAPQAVQVSLMAAVESMAPSQQQVLARKLEALLEHMGAGGETPALFFEEPAPAKPRRTRVGRV